MPNVFLLLLSLVAGWMVAVVSTGAGLLLWRGVAVLATKEKGCGPDASFAPGGRL
jgi:hypothetical protein